MLRLTIATLALFSLCAAPAGAANNVTIDNGGVTTGAFVAGVFTPSQPDATLDVDDLEAQLALGDVTVTSPGAGPQPGDVIVNAPIDAATGDLTLRPAHIGWVHINAPIDIPGALTADPVGGLVKIGADVTTGGPQSYTTGTRIGSIDPITQVPTVLTATGADVTFGADVQRDPLGSYPAALTVDASKVHLNGSMGASSQHFYTITLPDAEVSAGTIRSQMGLRTGDLELDGDVTVRSDFGTVTLGSVTGAHALTLPRPTVFDGPAGSPVPLTSLSATGRVTVGGPVTTTGDQAYNSLVLAADATLASTSGSVTVSSAADGAYDLTVNAATSFYSGGVGSTTPLSSLAITSGTRTTLHASTMAVTGTQTYHGPVELTSGPSFSGAVDMDAGLDLKATTATLREGTIAGGVAGSGTLVKAQAGTTLSLEGDGTFTGTLRVDAGRLAVTGNSPAATVLLNGGELFADGAIGAVTTGAGGRLATTTGLRSAALALGATVDVDLPLTWPGAALDASGAVDLTGAAANVSAGAVHPRGAELTLVANDGADAVTGAFTGLAEDDVLTAGGREYRLSYAGGDGNDVTLTHRPRSASVTVAVDPAKEGAPVTLAAAVDGGVHGTPSGDVIFLVDGVAIGTAPLTASAGMATGVATLATSALAAGRHELTVRYEGDRDFAPATSAPAAFEVAKPVPPVPPPPAAEPPRAGLSLSTPTVSAYCVAPKGRKVRGAARTLRFAYTLSDAARVTATLQRRVDDKPRTTCPANGSTTRGAKQAGEYEDVRVRGARQATLASATAAGDSARRPATRSGALARTSAAGAGVNRVTLAQLARQARLAPGSYRVLIRAVRADGSVAERTAKFIVLRGY